MVLLGFVDAHVCRQYASEGYKAGNVNAGDEILTSSKSVGVVPLSLLECDLDIGELRVMLY